MHKFNRRCLCLFSGTISLVAVQAALAAEPSNGSTADLPASAKDFIALLQQEKFDDAAKQFDDTMQQALPARQLRAVWEAIVKTRGNLQKIEPGAPIHVGKLKIVDAPCVFEDDTIVARISFNEQQKISGLFFLPTPKPAPAANGGPEVKLNIAYGTLYGTLDLPKGNGPWPIALIIAGSGPTDRDGNQPFMKNDSLKQLGEALAAQGMAALRYDKRGVGKSGAGGVDESKLRFEDYVGDAAAWIKQLRSDRRFNKIVIIGHSDGSLVGILAAKHEPIDALVSIAGSGRDAASLIRNQLQGKLSPELREKSNYILDELLAGRKVDNVPTDLAVLFRPSLQPYLLTWLKYNPAEEVRSLKIPLLVVQGTTDLQVSVDDAKLLASSNANARLVTIENMNHIMKIAPTATLAGQVATYSDPSLPLAPRLADELHSFITKDDRPTILDDSR